MSYWKKQGNNLRSLDNFGFSPSANTNGGDNNSEFYEFEPAIVLDVILDENHPIFQKGNKLYTLVDTDHWPADFKGLKPNNDDKDFSWIGRVLVRPIYSQENTEKDKLVWALPLDSNISEYPLINEIVIVTKYLNSFYYSRKLNSRNFPNNNVDFGLEFITKGDVNSELFDSKSPYVGPKSKTRVGGGLNNEGVVGRYFLINNNIRSVKRYEGDLTIESRFGQSMRFSSYDFDRKKDKSSPKYLDYKGNGVFNPFSNQESGGGNPMILIRNRQRPLVEKGKKIKPYSKLPEIVGTEAEKNSGGYLEENINHDGTSIHITSGVTISGFVTSCYKQMFQDGIEEQKGFSPSGCTSFKIPVFDGDQMVVNTDRLIFSSRYGETFHFSKKRYARSEEHTSE